MTKQQLQNGDSVEVLVTDKGILLRKYDKTGQNVTNKTAVSLGDELVKSPFLCLIEKGGYCIVWLQETSQGFSINLRKYTGLGLASKIIALSTENAPDGNLLNVHVQNASLLTVEWSSQEGMFSSVFNIDGSIHTKESKILHKTETLQEDIGKPTQENIKIEIIEPPKEKEPEPPKVPDSPKKEMVVEKRIVRPPVIEIPETPVSLDGLLSQQQTPRHSQVAQTPRRGVQLGFTANNLNVTQQHKQQNNQLRININSQSRRRGGGSMGMRFM